MGAVSLGASAQTLRSYEEFERSLRCFDNWLTGVVPGAMDLDCLIERRGHYLVFELKPWKGSGVAVSYGTHLCLKGLAGLEGFTVYLVGEESHSDGTHLHVVNYSDADPRIGAYRGRTEAWFPAEQFADTTVSELRGTVRNWWQSSSQ